ncbi:hypothetical protein CC2G_006732 [Coprinopsis cinerea AmutBmut pab1-1]|nr:hypothetical protein CC2G_006732 [Coprinopsis cinerea AmutBmut pab1-1]
MVSKAHPSAARACESSSPSCGGVGSAQPIHPSGGEGTVHYLSRRREWGGLCMADRGGPSSAIEREVLRL